MLQSNCVELELRRNAEYECHVTKDLRVTLLEDIAEFCGRITLSADDKYLQSLHLTDTLIAVLAGRNTGEGQELRLLFQKGSYEDLTGIASGFARLSEIDDICLGACVTPSSVAIPAAIMTASRVSSISPAQLSGAIHVATNIMIRLGYAFGGPALLKQGVWPTYLIAPVGACIAAALILGLSTTQIAHGLALAIGMSSQFMGRPSEEKSGRWFMFSCAVANGIRAALAAQRGLQGDLKLLDGGMPAFRNQSLSFNWQEFLNVQNSTYGLLSQKPHCTSRQCLSAVQAFYELILEGLNPTEVDSICVRVPAAYAAMISAIPEPQSRSFTLTSVALQIAIVAIDPDKRFHVDRGEILSSKFLKEYANRISVVPDESLQKFYPEQWPAEVQVRLGSGKMLTRRIIEAHGDPGNRLAEAEIVAKAHNVLDRLITDEEIEIWLNLGLRSLNEEQECQRLIQKFPAAVDHVGPYSFQ